VRRNPQAGQRAKKQGSGSARSDDSEGKVNSLKSLTSRPVTGTEVKGQASNSIKDDLTKDQGRPRAGLNGSAPKQQCRDGQPRSSHSSSNFDSRGNSVLQLSISGARTVRKIQTRDSSSRAAYNKFARADRSGKLTEFGGRDRHGRGLPCGLGAARRFLGAGSGSEARVRATTCAGHCGRNALVGGLGAAVFTMGRGRVTGLLGTFTERPQSTRLRGGGGADRPPASA